MRRCKRNSTGFLQIKLFKKKDSSTARVWCWF